MKHNRSFRKVSVKADLIRDVEDFIEKTRMYRSIAEFVSEAVRLRLIELSSPVLVRREVATE